MDRYELTEREAGIIRPLLESRERIEEATRNALTVITACRELDGPWTLITEPGGTLALVPPKP